jgi:hypothetical protein
MTLAFVQKISQLIYFNFLEYHRFCTESRCLAVKPSLFIILIPSLANDFYSNGYLSCGDGQLKIKISLLIRTEILF